MGLSNHSSNIDWLHTIQFGFPFRSCATPVLKSGQFTDPNENTQVRLAELEGLDERRLMAQ